MKKHELNEFIINLVGVTNGMQIITAVDKYCSASNDGKPLVSRSTCDIIFEQAAKDDYESNLHKHWKDDEDKTGYDSKPMGGFSSW